MPKSYARVWIHAVWSTKNRYPYIHPSIEHKLHQFIQKEFEKMNCPVRAINGMPDHVHCLFGLNPKIPLTDILKQIKGSSSFYMNEMNLIDEKFIWQRGFGVFGVSDSIADRVYHYIRNQKSHHLGISFETEYDRLLDQP